MRPEAAATGDGAQEFRIVRLNARLMPIHPMEATLYRRYGLRPVEVEAAAPAEIIPHVTECDALLVVSAALPRAVIDSLRQCRLISRLGTGTDKIDVAAATRRGILVANVPAFCVEEMADHAMAMLLALARRMPRMVHHMRAGTYNAARQEAVTTRRLNTRTLGLVGFGASAKALARRARAAGMRVLATRRDMTAPRHEAEALGVTMTALPALLAEADFVSLHLPLTTESYHLIDAAAIRAMKPGACLINTSRGALVDEDALVAALRAGHLAGAGLDTFEQIEIFAEGVRPSDHPLLELENVVLTPHVSGLSVEALEDVARTSAENLVSVLRGRRPLAANIVNPEVVPWMPLQEHDPALFATPAANPGEPS